MQPLVTSQLRHGVDRVRALACVPRAHAEEQRTARRQPNGAAAGAEGVEQRLGAGAVLRQRPDEPGVRVRGQQVGLVRQHQRPRRRHLFEAAGVLAVRRL